MISTREKREDSNKLKDLERLFLSSHRQFLTFKYHVILKDKSLSVLKHEVEVV